MYKRVSTLCLAALAFLLASVPAPAADRMSFIRDAEIENTIRLFATPLFRAAGLDPMAIRVHLITDNALNAFVAGGLNMFINTGLLIRSENPGQVIGVIAHETGHISGGHLVRTREALEGASAQTILGYVLGTAAAIGTGRGDVGAAVIAGSQQAGLRNFLQYSRTQESAADQAAVKLLDETGQSSGGLLEFMEVLEGQELLPASRQDPYVRTHPLSADRIIFLREHVQTSTYSGTSYPPDLVERHARMKAKLHGFLLPAARTLRVYKEDDRSIAARYGRAIAYYRRPDIPAALALMDGLIAERPDDAYFHEMKAQILFENGRGPEAIPEYETAVRLAPEEPLLLTELGRARLESGQPEQIPGAIDEFRRALAREPESSFVWTQLAIAYGRDGQMGMASLAQAEAAYLQGRKPDARYYAEKAAGGLKKDSAGWLRAQDILFATKEDKGGGGDERK